ncbi:MAG: flippase-like domain-containing protein [Flavobacteriales bacterium]|nr:flippase-like domain-containing protein [Flavobacteriales bacterium]
MKRIYGTLGFLLAILIFGGVAFSVFKDVDPLALLESIGVAGILQNFLIGIAYFFSFGILMKVVYQHHYKCDLSWADAFFLPFMMHLWTYILPVKGGLIYQTFFVKAKYGLDMSKGFSVGVLVFAASLLITCFVGGALSFLVRDALALQLVLLFMFGTLIFFLFAGRLVSEPDPSRSGVIYSLIAFVQKVLIQFREQLKDVKLLFKLVFVTLASTLVHAIWFYHCAYILGYDPEPVGILLATLVLRIVTLVRILPGNLGIQEVMIGSVFLAAGLGLQEGLTTALLVRLVSMVLAGTLGIGGLYLNFRYFGTDSLTGLLNKLKRSDT